MSKTSEKYINANQLKEYPGDTYAEADNYIVILLKRSKPTHVLMSYEQYLELKSRASSPREE